MRSSGAHSLLRPVLQILSLRLLKTKQNMVWGFGFNWPETVRMKALLKSSEPRDPGHQRAEPGYCMDQLKLYRHGTKTDRAAQEVPEIENMCRKLASSPI